MEYIAAALTLSICSMVINFVLFLMLLSVANNAMRRIYNHEENDSIQREYYLKQIKSLWKNVEYLSDDIVEFSFLRRTKRI